MYKNALNLTSPPSLYSDVFPCSLWSSSCTLRKITPPPPGSTVWSTPPPCSVVRPSLPVSEGSSMLPLKLIFIKEKLVFVGGSHLFVWWRFRKWKLNDFLEVLWASHKFQVLTWKPVLTTWTWTFKCFIVVKQCNMNCIWIAVCKIFNHRSIN